MESRTRESSAVTRLRHAATRVPPDLRALERWVASYPSRAAQCRALRRVIKEVQGLHMDWVDVWVWCWAAQTLRLVQSRARQHATEARHDQ